jgi:hypothetical protein
MANFTKSTSWTFHCALSYLVEEERTIMHVQWKAYFISTTNKMTDSVLEGTNS